MDSTQPHRAEVRPSWPPRGRARAIVVVEGNGVLAELLRGAAGGTGFEIAETSTIEGALREIEATASAVAVVDDDLPVMRGMDVLGRLRAERPDLESVLVTRDLSIASMVSRLHIERLQCLRNPLHLDDLRNAVAQAIDSLLRRERASRTTPGAAERVTSGPPALGVRTSRPPLGDGDEGLRVLVVDDDPVVRRSMARTFRRHHVTTAENGRAAAAEIERHKPDVIISDLKMPEMDGFELADQIKERWPDLANRIVFVSGTNSQIERARTEAPSQPLVMKPVNSHELEARIAEVLHAATLDARPRRR
jgi:DNA-binding NtrC family response regulator